MFELNLKDYFKKLVKDVNFWSVTIFGVIYIIIGKVLFSGDGEAWKFSSGLMLGVGITLICLVISNIMIAWGKLKSRKDADHD